MILVQWL